MPPGAWPGDSPGPTVINAGAYLMPPTFPPLIQGTMRTADVYSYVPPSVQGIAAQWYANRNPLWARLRKEYLPTWAFDMKGFRFRPRTGTLTADPATGTTLTLTDAS